jgi:hypothetical protein
MLAFLFLGMSPAGALSTDAVPAVLPADPVGEGSDLLPIEPGAAPCDPYHVDGLGWICDRAGGLMDHFNHLGEYLGTSHGPDPHEAPEVPASTPGTGTSWWPERNPVCVDKAAEDYYIEVIYARAYDDTDRFATREADLKKFVRQSNGIIDYTAMFGLVHADLRVVCSGGDILVQNEVLPTSKSADSSSTLVNDLKAKGYNKPNAKYWILYEGGISCGCSGLGYFFSDDTGSAANRNNGGYAMYAMTFCMCLNTWLHELGHNLGAVQYSAPNTSGGAHCIDGVDVMCYSDGGWNAANYTSTACSVRVFDCNQNDYFNAAPAPGSYLATKWNIGASYNRFISFRGVVLDTFTCTSRLPSGGTADCTLKGGNPAASGVKYTVQWGDGATTTSPASGYHATGTTVVLNHTYSGTGTWTATAWATDNSSPALESARLNRFIEARDNWPPDLLGWVCPARVAPGVALTCTATTSDFEGDALELVVDWSDGTSVHNATATTVVSHTYSAEATYTVTATARETKAGGLSSSSRTQSVVVKGSDPPAMDPITCIKTYSYPLRLQCTFKAADPDGDSVRFRIEWGDGSVTTTAYAASPTTQVVTHTYPDSASRTLQARAEENTPTAKTSAYRSFTWDERAPTIRVYDPDTYSVYNGCSRKVGPIDPRPITDSITISGGIIDTSWVPPPGSLMVEKGCLRFEVTDDHSGVDGISLYIPGACAADRYPYFTSGGYYEFEYDVCRSGWGAVQIYAWDAKYNWAWRDVWVEDLTGTRPVEEYVDTVLDWNTCRPLPRPPTDLAHIPWGVYWTWAPPPYDPIWIDICRIFATDL